MSATMVERVASLSEHEHQFSASLGPSDRAKRLAPKMHELAGELRHLAKTTNHAATQEIRNLEAEWCASAADLLRVLEQEQWRQREAIKLFLCGQVDRGFLRDVCQSWNGDTAPAPAPADPPDAAAGGEG